MVEVIKRNYEYYTGTINEYCQAQRQGKTTVMTYDGGRLLDNRVYPYEPDDFYCNYRIMIDGFNCGNNEQMVEWLKQCRKDRWHNKVFMVDEASQPPLPFYARGWKKDEQTEIVTMFWQFPKLGNTLLYSDNLGSSVDVQLRDATQFTIIPFYHHGVMEDRSDDRIDVTVIANHELWVGKRVLYNPAAVQKWFNSFKEVT